MTHLLFDGGTVNDPSQIRIESDELDGYAFLPWDEAAARLPGTTSARIPAARTARATSQAVYLPASV